MEVNCFGRIRNFGPPVCLCFLLSLCFSTQVLSALPWKTENPIANILSRVEGQSVVCDGTVCRIAARNNPAFFVLADGYIQDSRIVVLGRVPESLRDGTAVTVCGTLGRLPNNEPCIVNATTYVFVKKGMVQNWTPFFGFEYGLERQILSTPIGLIPSSDPCLSNSSDGLAGEVTAALDYNETTEYSTVQSLLSGSPTLLSLVRLSCKPVKNVGQGYIVIGDDATTAVVKVFTNTPAKVGDRVINLTGTVHTENDNLVLYAGSGVAPYFDEQGESGGVFITSPGDSAYASSLTDASHMAANSVTIGEMHAASTDPSSQPDTEINTPQWVYLTGRIITGSGKYYTGDAPSSSDPDVYYIQSLDRTPGIRVWCSEDAVAPVGQVVDVMAQVTTNDGERILGIVGDTSSVYQSTLSPTYGYECNIKPVFVANKTLGGASLGSNPGVTDGVGLYNIGSRVRVCGKVTGKGYLAYSWWDAPYLQIDDGSSVPWDDTFLLGLGIGNVASSTGVLIVDPPNISNIDIDDYVAVTGISSLWKFSSEGSSYRAIRFPTSVEEVSSTSYSTTSTVLTSGNIPVSVTVYGAANQTCSVRAIANDGKSWSNTVTCNSQGVGTWSFTWTSVPLTLDTNGDNSPDVDLSGTYAVSVHCEGFKTRTSSRLTPGSSTVDLHVVPLRKIYPIEVASYHLDPCSSPSTTVTTKVVDADNEPIVNQNVKFWVENASLSSTGQQSVVIDQTDSCGIAEATVYAGYPGGSVDYVYVMATDDLNTPMPSGNGITSPYDIAPLYDWVAPENEPGYGIYGQTYLDISAYQPTLTLSPSSIGLVGVKRCESRCVTATLESCGSGVANDSVTFSISSQDGAAVFNENSSTLYTTTTDTGGNAVATIHPLQPGRFDLWVTTTVNGKLLTKGQFCEVKEFSPLVVVSADPETIYAAGESLITFNATDSDGLNKQGAAIQANTSAGTFLSYPGRTTLPNPTTLTTGSDGNANVYLVLNPAQSATVTGVYNDDCLGLTPVTTKIVYRQSPWIVDIGTGYSSPIVDNLIPGDLSPNTGNELAFIATDGKINVRYSSGGSAWISTDTIDASGNNTLSCADIDNLESLELSAPDGTNQLMHVFGYSSGFMPLAGWPASSEYSFNTISAALGDSNLDGTIKVVAGDSCCEVSDWNAVGQPLWSQATYNGGVSIIGTSVALGAINTPTNSNRPPEAVVGANHTNGIWGYAGNDWGHYYPSYHYTARFTKPQSGNVNSSPAIGPIDSDSSTSINDIAMGSASGQLWVWLSTDSQWHTYNAGSPINTAPALVNFNGQNLILFGCDNGRAYAVRWNSTTSALVDADGWGGGISLSTGSAIKASPVIGDVMNIAGNAPQAVFACVDGNVCALWLDGTLHNTNGDPVAKMWTCAQSSSEYIYSTPVFCSLDNSTVSLIVVSTSNIYKMDLYSAAFDSGSSRWPWPTFHHDNARTGCMTAPSATMVSSSIVGRITTTVNGNVVGIEGASVKLQYWTGSSWSQSVAVYQPASTATPTRTNPVVSAGANGTGNEINEGGFVFNQLTPSKRYRLAVTYSGTTRYFSVNGDVAVSVGRCIQDVTW